MKAAFFDLDGTLTERDTLLHWLVLLKGWPAVVAIFAKAWVVGSAFEDPYTEDRRGRIKAYVLAKLLHDIPIDQAEAAGESIKKYVRWKADICQKLEAHRRANHKIVIVTGAPSIYVPSLLKDTIIFDHLIGTTLDIQKGCLTGRLAATNNVRQAKKRRVESFLKNHGPFTETWGYGNAPHDLPMLSLLTHKNIV